MPKQWNTKEITALLSDLGGVHPSGPGGDYDTTCLTVYPKGKTEWISISGFTDHETVTNPDNALVTWVEVRTDGDSAGGLQTEDEEVGAAYGRIIARLIKAGFNPVPTHDGLF